MVNDNIFLELSTITGFLSINYHLYYNNNNTIFTTSIEKSFTRFNFHSIVKSKYPFHNRKRGDETSQKVFD